MVLFVLFVVTLLGSHSETAFARASLEPAGASKYAPNVILLTWEWAS